MEIKGDQMSLTQCPDCHKLCFINEVVCLSCGRTFQPGVLRRKAQAEELAFNLKCGVLYSRALVSILATLIFVVLRD